jgi:hypothetical protein
MTAFTALGSRKRLCVCRWTGKKYHCQQEVSRFRQSVTAALFDERSPYIIRTILPNPNLPNSVIDSRRSATYYVGIAGAGRKPARRY